MVALSQVALISCSKVVSERSQCGTINSDRSRPAQIRRWNSGGRFDNFGNLSKTGEGSFVINCSNSCSNANGNFFSNSGVFEIRSGHAEISGNGIDTGTYVVSSGATLAFGRGGRILQNGILSGEGSLDPLGVGSFLSLQGATSYELADLPEITGGHLNLRLDRTLTTPTLKLSTGQLSGDSDLTVVGTFNWSGGIINGTGTLRVDGPMAISGTSFWCRPADPH